MEEFNQQQGVPQRSFWRRAFVGLFVLLFSVLSLSLIVQTPFIQNWGLRQITEYLEFKMETKVDVAEFDLDIFRHLELENVYIESPIKAQDTLLYSKNLQVNFTSLLGILSGKFTINEIALNDGLLRFRRNEELGKSSITYLFEKLGMQADKELEASHPSDENQEKRKSNLEFSLEKIDLRNVRLEYMDDLKSFEQSYQVGEAKVDLRSLDFENRIIHANALDLRNADIVMIKTGAPKDELLLIPSETPQSNEELLNAIADPIATPPEWKIMIDDLKLEDCRFQMDNFYKSKEPRWSSEYVDYHHLKIDDIDIEADQFSMQDLRFEGQNARLHILHQNGFEVKNLSSDFVYVNDTSMMLQGALLELNGTTLRDTIIFSYDDYIDFDSFEDKINIRTRSRRSTIALNDIVRLIPSLANSEFFVQNRNRTVYLDGLISGTLNRLRFRDMDLRSGGIQLSGNFRSRDLAIKDNEIVSLDIDTSQIDVSELESWLPNVEIPDDFKKLGQINFQGNFDGYFQDFVADGYFRSNLGNAHMDMGLDLKAGRENAQYSGRIALENFDIGAFTNNPDLGRVTLSGTLSKGRGLTRESAYAELDGVIDNIDFRGYAYQDIQLDGKLNEKLFDGSFSITDPFADIDFAGVIDFRDSIPDYNFQAAINQLDLFHLNLANVPLALSGNFDVDLRALDIDQLFGQAHATDIRITDSTGTAYVLDSLYLNSRYDDIDLRSFRVYTDMIDARVVGEFKVREVVPLVKKHLKTYYPRYFSNFTIPDSLIINREQNLAFQIDLKDSKNWFGLFGIPDLKMRNVTLDGSIDSRSDLISLKGNIPELHYGNVNIYRADYRVDEKAGEAESDFHIVVLDVNQKMIFEEISLANAYANDKIDFQLNTTQLTEVFDKINVKAQYLPGDDFDQYHITPIELRMLKSKWQLDTNNVMRIWKDRIEVQDFALTNGTQKIDFSNFGDRGVEMRVEGFDMSYLDEIWVYDKLDFNGTYVLNASVADVFDFSKYKAELFVPDILINGDPYGYLRVDANMPALGDKALLNVEILDGKKGITGTGYLYPSIKEVAPELRNNWNLDVSIDTFPMRFWQYIIGDNISNTQGYMNADVTFGGKINQSTLNGTGRVFDGQTMVNYLGTTYFFDDQSFVVNDQMIDMTGVILTDEAGNEAVMTGGLTHRYIKDLGLDARISSPRFIGLKTTPEQNPVYYGYAIGQMLVTFNGRLNGPTISLNGETAEGTYLAIPVDYGTETSEVDFVQFTDLKRDTITSIQQRDISLKGVNFNMNITVNEGAVLEIIFDEQSGEILRGTGNGDIQFSLTNTGVMNMTGVYEIEQGNYLFTNFIVRKPFVLKKGGTIRWDGDPFDARIDVEAGYERLRASTAVFIEEYLLNASNNARNDAGIRTDVDLKLLLTGSLSQPDIDFEIEFPNLTGEVRGYVDSKMRILKSDQNAMLEQVMGLLLTKSFLPTNTIVNSAGQVATSGLFNTVSELISAQLSTYLSGFLSDAVEGVGFINSIDFDIGFDFNPLGQSSVFIVDPNQLLSESGNEVDFRLTNRLFNDRITLDIGGNYTTSSPLLEGGRYFAGDYALEYQLTDDRRLKIRFYHRNDVTIEGRKNKLGLGLSWRREFDDFSELFSAKKSKEKEIVN